MPPPSGACPLLHAAAPGACTPAAPSQPWAPPFRPPAPQSSGIRWASRWDTYLLMIDDQIHWFSIINSVMIVLFLTGMVAMIIVRTLHRDITKYNALESGDDAQEETGWKLVGGGRGRTAHGARGGSGISVSGAHVDGGRGGRALCATGGARSMGWGPGQSAASCKQLLVHESLCLHMCACMHARTRIRAQVHGDVFRPPPSASLLATFVGTGVQLLGMAMVTVLFALLGFLSPANRGGLMTAMLMMFVFMGLFAGYFSARLYKSFRGEEWKRTTLRTAMLFPGAWWRVCVREGGWGDGGRPQMDCDGCVAVRVRVGVGQQRGAGWEAGWLMGGRPGLRHQHRAPCLRPRVHFALQMTTHPALMSTLLRPRAQARALPFSSASTSSSGARSPRALCPLARCSRCASCGSASPCRSCSLAPTLATRSPRQRTRCVVD